jgi:hypothetical protein
VAPPSVLPEIVASCGPSLIGPLCRAVRVDGT